MLDRDDEAAERHRALVRAANRARAKAIKELKRRYPEEFEQLYAEQAALEGVTSKPRRLTVRRQIAELEAELARLLDEAGRTVDG